MTTGANPTPAPTAHDRAREAIADVLGGALIDADEIVMVGKGSDPRLYRNEEAILAALEAAGLAVVDAGRDTLLALPEVSREELAIELCREIGAEVYQLVNGDIDQMCGIVGIHEPEGWLAVADALLATWRVVRRQDGGKQ